MWCKNASPAGAGSRGACVGTASSRAFFTAAADPRAFYVNERELRRVLTGDHGLHAILDVVLDGQEKAHHAVLKDYQLDARRSTLMHVDLHEVRLDRTIQTQVAIEAVGTPEGVTQGGILQVLVHQANVEALPMEIPDRLEIDVTDLNIGDSAQMARLQVPERVTLLDDPETVIVAVLAPRALELPEDVVEEGERRGGRGRRRGCGGGCRRAGARRARSRRVLVRRREPVAARRGARFAV